MPLKTIPVIDISPFKDGDATARKCVVEKVKQACVEIGFLIISGHGIPSSTLQNIVTAYKKFFALEQRRRARSRGRGPKSLEGTAEWSRKDLRILRTRKRHRI